MTEQFANNASSTLNGTITNVQTTLVVNSAAPFPSVPQFRILVESEIMLVTGVAGTTFTVSRGVENTVQATHNNGVAVTQILTAGAIAQSKVDAVTVRTLSTVKTAPYIMANSDDVVLFNTSSGSFSISLPATPGSGEAHLLVDTGGQAALNPLTVSGNGNNIVTLNGSVASSDTVGSTYGTARYIFNGTVWNLIKGQQATIGTRVPPDSNDVAVWTFQESAAPFANSGSGSADNINLLTGTLTTQASGLVLPYSLHSGLAAAQLSTTVTNSATDTAIEPSTNITVSLWCKMTGFNQSGSAQHLIAKLYRPYSTFSSPFVAAEITMQSNSSGTFSLATSIATGGVISGPTITQILGQGEWAHIGYTYDGANVKQYVNGVQTGSVAKTGAIDWGTHGPWIFGQNPASTGEGNFNGLMQDVRIANVARPASYFRTVYRAGVGLSLP